MRYKAKPTEMKIIGIGTALLVPEARRSDVESLDVAVDTSAWLLSAFRLSALMMLLR